MRSCRRADDVRTALAAGEPLYDELAHHARSCADCTGAIAQYRRFELGLHDAVDQVITDALPADTLSAARMDEVPGRKRAFPRLVVSGLSAAVVLFAAVGIAATGAGVVDALNSRGLPPVDPDLVQSEFTTCYVEEAIVSGAAGDGPVTVTVDRCLDDASRALDVVDYRIVVRLNREATDTTACLRTRGWDVEPVLEPRGRFLVPPASTPAGGDRQTYVRDMETCTEGQR